MVVRKTLPWVISLGLHAVILVVPLGLLTAPAPKTFDVVGVDIALVGAPGAGGGGRGRTASSGGLAVSSGDMAGSSGGGDVVLVPRPGIRQSRLSAASLPRVSTDLPRSVLPMEDTGPVESAAAFSLPSTRDILADVAALTGSGSGKAAGSGGGGSAMAAGTPSDGNDGPAGVVGALTGPAGTRIGWAGTPRKLIRKRDPRFPDVLAATGQEIEGEARIIVAPSGVVTRVEMTRSTGYSEIDAGIEASLRDYLFSRVDGKGDAVGTVRFRFRLEKRD